MSHQVWWKDTWVWGSGKMEEENPAPRLCGLVPIYKEGLVLLVLAGALYFGASRQREGKIREGGEVEDSSFYHLTGLFLKSKVSGLGM